MINKLKIDNNEYDLGSSQEIKIADLGIDANLSDGFVVLYKDDLPINYFSGIKVEIETTDGIVNWYFKALIYDDVLDAMGSNEIYGLKNAETLLNVGLFDSINMFTLPENNYFHFSLSITYDIIQKIKSAKIYYYEVDETTMPINIEY